MIAIRPVTSSECDVVLELWQQACIEAVGHPLREENARQVLLNLRQYAIHETCHCLVAVNTEDEILGFVTLSVLRHPIEQGAIGQVEELYVLPQSNRDDIRAMLVQQAVLQLKQHGVHLVTTRVAVDEPDDLAFWQSLKWEQDTVNFTIYSHVPADPESQAVWDSYTS